MSIRRWCNRVTFPLAGALLFDRARPVIDILELVVTARCLSFASAASESSFYFRNLWRLILYDGLELPKHLQISFVPHAASHFARCTLEVIAALNRFTHLSFDGTVCSSSSSISFVNNSSTSSTRT